VTSALKLPTSLARLPDGRWLVTEKLGSLVIVSQDGKVSSAIVGVPTVTGGGTGIGTQGGLLDVTLAPDFATSRMIFLGYGEPRPSNKSGAAIASARLSNDEKSLENFKVILKQNPDWAGTLQYGIRMAWDREGNLFVLLGERSEAGARVLAQDKSTLLGKVVRIKTDGSPATGNPFIGVSGAKPEIWSYGHRSPQGAAIHPDTGELWTIEHGPRGGDEINRPQAGKNYGWPQITYGIDYSGQKFGDGSTAKAGMEQPLYYWDPVIAPSNMIFYQGNMFSAWNKNLIIAALGVKGLVRIVLDGDKILAEERFLTNLNRVRDLEVDSAGAIWIVNDDGQMVKVTK
jgi:glucose/arabinose dehydrogenase